MFKKLIKLHLTIFSILLIALPSSALCADAADDSAQTEIQSIDVQTADGSTTILIRTNQKVAEYESNTVEGTDTTPARMFIDLNNTAIKDDVASEIFIGTSLDRIRVASNAYGVRIVFDSKTKEMFSYGINSTDTGVAVEIAEISKLSASDGPDIGTGSGDNTLDDLIESSVKELEKKPGTPGSEAEQKEKAMEDSFAFSGYKNHKISLDIYKMDLHNVFRFFRDISGLNIIVDSGVKGTLTLSLNDVPWDFALDIILNLTGLKKEERFNTIVIYPSKKKFKWPERTAADNLEIEADIEVLEEESLVVQQAAAQSKEILLAKESLRKAKLQEKAENFDEALDEYAAALKLWPTNAKIANRMATIYLVHLQMNAKAAYYAEESLKIKPSDKAAMYAAIAYANMQQQGRAMQYFDQSVSGNPPMKEALVSYAAFSENIDNLPGALKLLNRFGDQYGHTMDTMVSRARVLDKMGQADQAADQYRSVLASGYPIAPDLKKYINNRLAN